MAAGCRPLCGDCWGTIQNARLEMIPTPEGPLLHLVYPLPDNHLRLMLLRGREIVRQLLAQE